MLRLTLKNQTRESESERKETKDIKKKKTNSHRVYGGDGNDGHWRFIIQFLLGVWFEIRSSMLHWCDPRATISMFRRYFIIEIVA